MLFRIVLGIWLSCVVTNATYLAKPDQNKFCTFCDTAVRVRITSIQNKEKDTVRYGIDVLERAFKMPGKKLSIKCAESVRDACGLIKELEVGAEYVLSGTSKGKTLQITLCDSIIVKGEPTARQLQNYRGGYDCTCQVKYCVPGENCDNTANMCAVSYYKSTCYDKYSVCERNGDEVCQFSDPEKEPDFDSYCQRIFALPQHLFMP